jgi:hypothetical protein
VTITRTLGGLWIAKQGGKVLGWSWDAVNWATGGWRA